MRPFLCWADSGEQDTTLLSWVGRSGENVRGEGGTTAPERTLRERTACSVGRDIVCDPGVEGQGWRDNWGAPKPGEDGEERSQ